MGSRVAPRLIAAVLGAATVASIVMLVASNCRARGTPAEHVAMPGGPTGEARGSGARGPGSDADGVHLTGVVVDGLGQPVAGALVRAELEVGFVDRSLTGPAGNDAGVPDDIKLTGVSSPPTGADGQFAITDLEPGRYRVRVSGTGLLSAEVRMIPVPSDATRIVVARQVSIEGSVTDGGVPTPGVTVGLRGEAIGGGVEVKTGLDGKFVFPELPEGRYQLFAYRGGLAARAIRVNRLGAGPFAPVELRLETATIVIGRVIDRDDGTGVSAAIELRPSGDDQASRFARTDPDGGFRIEGIPNGRWIAEAYAVGYLPGAAIELEAGRGVPELALTRGGTIEGRVVDANGRPVDGATVRTLAPVSTGAATKSIVEVSELAETDRLRRFSGFTAAPAPTSARAGADPLLIARGELGVMVGPIPPLPPPGATSARPAVVDPTYAALAGTPAPLASMLPASVWTTGPDGRYRITGLPKGRTRVVASARGYADGRSREVSIAPREVASEIDVILTAGTVLVGRVSDQHGVPVVGARVSATLDSGAPLDGFTDAAGDYRLGPIAGRVDVLVTSYGHGDARRSLELEPTADPRAAERREDFTLVVADAVLAGTLDDANGTPVAAAHIEVVVGAGEGRFAVAAPDGTFALELLPAGPLRVRISHPDYPPFETEVIASSGGREKVRIRIPIGAAVEGAILDAASGAPLTGITITGAGPGGAISEASSDSAGRWKLGPLVPGRWKVTATLAGYLSTTLEIDVAGARAPGETSVRDVRLELLRGALVGGTIRDRRGQRMAGAAVTIQRADGRGTPVDATTDSAGEFRARDCPTGELVVTATSGELRGVTTVTVRPGDEILGLSLDVE